MKNRFIYAYLCLERNRGRLAAPYFCGRLLDYQDPLSVVHTDRRLVLIIMASNERRMAVKHRSNSALLVASWGLFQNKLYCLTKEIEVVILTKVENEPAQ
jgi:hypothetical protein